MCIPGLDPVTLIGLAASGAGAALNAKMQNQFYDAQSDATRKAMAIETANRDAEVARQRAFESSSAEEVARALTQVDPAAKTEEVAQKVADPGNEIVASADAYNTPKLQGQVEDGVVSEGIGKIISDALARTKTILRGAATLSAQGTGLQGGQDVLGRLASTLSTINSNRRGSAGVAQLETNIPAATVNPSQSPVGDILMLGGNLAAGVGGRKAGYRGAPLPGDVLLGGFR